MAINEGSKQRKTFQIALKWRISLGYIQLVWKTDNRSEVGPLIIATKYFTQHDNHSVFSITTNN